MVLDPIPQSLPVHFFGSRPQPPTSRCMHGSPSYDIDFCCMAVMIMISTIVACQWLLWYPLFLYNSHDHDIHYCCMAVIMMIFTILVWQSLLWYPLLLYGIIMMISTIVVWQSLLIMIFTILVWQSLLWYHLLLYVIIMMISTIVVWQPLWWYPLLLYGSHYYCIHNLLRRGFSDWIHHTIPASKISHHYWIHGSHYFAFPIMTDSTKYAAPPKSSKSRNSHSSVQIPMGERQAEILNQNLTVYLYCERKKETELLDLVEFRGYNNSGC